MVGILCRMSSIAPRSGMARQEILSCPLEKRILTCPSRREELSDLEWGHRI